MSNSKPIFLDVDSSIVENNLRIRNDSEEELNKLFGNKTNEHPSKIIKPHPGLCVKTKELGSDCKVFVNICTTDSIPPPKDISEADLVEIIESDDGSTFRVPMSIGEIRSEEDKKGNEAKAVDIAINTAFFKKIETYQSFKNFFMAIVFQGLLNKYGLVCQDEKIILTNRKAYGTLQMHRIQQREIDEKMGKITENSSAINELTGANPPAKKVVIETISSVEHPTKRPEYRLYKKKIGPNCLIGEFKFPDIISPEEITLDVGEDRIILESKSKGYLLDVFVPYCIRNEKCSSKFDKALKTMERLGDPVLVAKIQNFLGVKTITQNAAKTERSHYVITNKLWYYLFLFGTALGDEVFYSAFIPFWFWNIDGAVGRRVVLVWTLVMYIGQSIKDIIRWPRPGPPVVQLQKKWALEYGFPSTHAMVGVSIPFSVVLYTMNRYEYNITLGLTVAFLWCTIVCFSRLYLGMHSVLDIVAGLVLAITLMIPLVPLIDYLDSYLLTNPTSPFLLLTLSILMIVYYPNSGKWTPTRGDTTMIISVCVGVLIGAWLNYQTGLMTAASDLTLPHMIMWPSWSMFGCLLLRTLIGFFFVFLTRQVFKSVSYSFICMLLKQDENKLKRSENTLQNKHKTIVELGCKYVTCGMIGFNILYALPQLFRFLRIERLTFFTEI